jgi:acyl dehydratase
VRYAEDDEPGRTYRLGTYHVTAHEIIEFGRRFDPQPYHVDPERAERSRFNGLVASGWHVCAMFMRLYTETLLLDTAVEGSPGVDEVRWIRPVRPGDDLTGYLTAVGVAPSLSLPDCALVRRRGELVDAAGNQVLRMLIYSLFRKGPRAK